MNATLYMADLIRSVHTQSVPHSLHIIWQLAQLPQAVGNIPVVLHLRTWQQVVAEPDLCWQWFLAGSW